MTKSIAFALAAVLVALSMPLTTRAESLDWKTNFAEAKTTAAREKRSLLLDFTGSDWCPWCVKMDKEVFSQPAFATFAAKNLVLVKLDFPRTQPQSASEKAQNQRLASEFHVEGFRTYVLLDPSGKEVRRQEGYLPGGPSVFIDWVGVTGGLASTQD